MEQLRETWQVVVRTRQVDFCLFRHLMGWPDLPQLAPKICGVLSLSILTFTELKRVLILSDVAKVPASLP